MYTLIMVTKKKRPGRPFLPKADRRSSTIIVRITDRQFVGLSKRAQAVDKTVSSYVAELIKQDLEG